ncbi:flagellar protein FlgN [Blastopirellula sp. JC732]|uniref:Flagellar protein FlgN n=1 Tax=Blastopirellula sediminis TaxID=2894196 RepID=A0A9X1SJP8_9BACT|nr:flagellar export chaperone FlgN [Blastopirellula sediminis]MCC9607668.1 flagellar protein FlgN [Blastopirellula sediminis]MCC9629039.1 flagellar protein FlgN [Blastopirellula sediminis]
MPFTPIDDASQTSAVDWESSTAEVLQELTSVQDELIEVLGTKRSQMVARDIPGMEATQQRELELIKRLEQLRDARHSLLTSAQQHGLPSDSIQSLAEMADGAEGERLREIASSAKLRMRTIQNETLVNFVLAQRSVLHLSQILQIIATGGKLQPTYEQENSAQQYNAQQGGSLVDLES